MHVAKRLTFWSVLLFQKKQPTPEPVADRLEHGDSRRFGALMTHQRNFSPRTMVELGGTEKGADFRRFSAAFPPGFPLPS